MADDNPHVLILGDLPTALSAAAAVQKDFPKYVVDAVEGTERARTFPNSFLFVAVDSGDTALDPDAAISRMKEILSKAAEPEAAAEDPSKVGGEDIGGKPSGMGGLAAQLHAAAKRSGVIEEDDEDSEAA